MFWIWVAGCIGVLAATAIVIGAKAYWAHRLGRVCSTCKYDAGDGSGMCYQGMGWEPEPVTRACGQWEHKET